MAERRYELGLFKFRPKSIAEEAYSSDLGRIHTAWAGYGLGLGFHYF